MTKAKKDQKLKAGLSQSGLKELLCMLDLWEEKGRDRRKLQQAESDPVSAKIESLIATIYERHVIEVTNLLKRHT